MEARRERDVVDHPRRERAQLAERVTREAQAIIAKARSSGYRLSGAQASRRRACSEGSSVNVTP